jgi:NAD-dependent SIR2 family protein deacetylase
MGGLTNDNTNIPFKLKVETAAKWFSEANHLVILTGSGISTESGILDFQTMQDVGKDNFDYLKLVRDITKVPPNAAHIALVQLQEMGYLKFLISQNIDNLHRKSGIQDDIIAEIHGNLELDRCKACGKKYSKLDFNRPPKCECGGKITLSVIKFNEELPKLELDLSKQHVNAADVFCVIGTSLKVSPASQFPGWAKQHGAKVIFINKDKTGLDYQADLLFHNSAGKVLTAILSHLEKKA